MQPATRRRCARSRRRSAPPRSRAGRRDRCRRRRCRSRSRRPARTRSTCPRAFNSSSTPAPASTPTSSTPGCGTMVVERADGMQRVDARRFDGRLHVHAEIEDVEQHEQNLLILAVAARRADREERLAVLEDDGRRQRRARPLAAGEHVRARRIEVECLHPVAHRHAGAPATNAPPSIQPELGVAEKRLPSASATWTDVVSPGSLSG